ncbi:MAG TPA: SDR family oxidoreductase [Amycolatopsis sp.]|nr:SDR family oxidoreductase [Amycolatopsis sp.]
MSESPAVQAFTLTDRVAVVTGAASGIGSETAVVFAEAGADLVLADRDPAGLRLTEKRVRELGRSVRSHTVDVTDRGQVEDLADAAVAEFGAVDVWANVAGVIGYFSLDDATEPDVRRIVDVNLLGVYWGVAAAGRRMTKKGRGSIVNVASTGGEVAVPRLSVYGMTKAGVIHLTKTAAAEYGSAGVRVNAVAPGFVETPMVAVNYTAEDGSIRQDARDALITARAQGAALGTIGTPRDIALALLYLASDASSFMTGQTLRPNGGTTMS